MSSKPSLPVCNICVTDKCGKCQPSRPVNFTAAATSDSNAAAAASVAAARVAAPAPATANGNTAASHSCANCFTPHCDDCTLDTPGTQPVVDRFTAIPYGQPVPAITTADRVRIKLHSNTFQSGPTSVPTEISGLSIPAPVAYADHASPAASTSIAAAARDHRAKTAHILKQAKQALDKAVLEVEEAKRDDDMAKLRCTGRTTALALKIISDLLESKPVHASHRIYDHAGGTVDNMTAELQKRIKQLGLSGFTFNHGEVRYQNPLKD
jgi:hypothetical protein